MSKTNQTIPTIFTDDALVIQKLTDAQVPGSTIEFDPDEAERAGCFVEDAISEKDAIDGVDYPDTKEE